MQELIIRQILESEYDKMYALRHAVLRVPLGLDLYTQDFSSEVNYTKFGAFIQQQLVGCVLIEFLPNNVAKIRQMAVDNGFQQQGIGRQLIQFAEQYCIKQEVKTITMHARLSAKLFYESIGYEVVGEAFTEVTIPHIIMQKIP